MKYFTLFIIALISINCFGQEYSKNWKDLNYAGDTNEYHRLDIYLPKVEKPTYPVVISIYGSAWFGNNLKGSDLPTLGKALLDAGFAVVFPNHRSSFDAKFPAQIHDIKAAIRFIRGNAEKYQIDTTFIGITGSSSGGHLATLAGTSGMVKQFTIGTASADLEGNLGEFTSFSSSVDAVVDWFGPTNFLAMDSCGSSMEHNPPNSPESNLIGGAIQENKDKCALANPITYIDANDPPFLILHGDKDPLVPHCNSEMLFEALQKVNVESQFFLVPGAQHGPGLFIEKYYKMMTDFFLMKAGQTKIDTEGMNLPDKFRFPQNYPNPFNLETLFSYELPVQNDVNLKIYDVLGKEVDTLVNEEKQAGLNTVIWNADKFQSGIYFAKLTAGRFEKSIKVVLQK